MVNLTEKHIWAFRKFNFRLSAGEPRPDVGQLWWTYGQLEPALHQPVEQWGWIAGQDDGKAIWSGDEPKGKGASQGVGSGWDAWGSPDAQWFFYYLLSLQALCVCMCMLCEGRLGEWMHGQDGWSGSLERLYHGLMRSDVLPGSVWLKCLRTSSHLLLTQVMSRGSEDSASLPFLCFSLLLFFQHHHSNILI